MKRSVTIFVLFLVTITLGCKKNGATITGGTEGRISFVYTMPSNWRPLSKEAIHKSKHKHLIMPKGWTFEAAYTGAPEPDIDFPYMTFAHIDGVQVPPSGIAKLNGIILDSMRADARKNGQEFTLTENSYDAKAKVLFHDVTFASQKVAIRMMANTYFTSKGILTASAVASSQEERVGAQIKDILSNIKLVQ